MATADRDGLRVTTLATTAGTTPAGMNIIGIFASLTAPTSPAETTSIVEPFAFSAAGNNTQPFFWCVSTLTEITDLAATDLATKKLTGGQKADCYVASVGNNALGANAGTVEAWIGEVGNFKRAVTITVLSVKTDTKTIPNIGLMAANDAAKVTAFTDGLTTTELQDIMSGAGASGTAVSQYTVKILNDADWTGAPPITAPPTP